MCFLLNAGVIPPWRDDLLRDPAKVSPPVDGLTNGASRQTTRYRLSGDDRTRTGDLLRDRQSL